MDLHPDWKEFLDLLNEKNVEFLIVGAFALAHHGLARLTGGIDVWVNPTPENAQKLSQALSAFGYAASAGQMEEFSTRDRIWTIGVRPFRIDVLTSIKGVDFEDARARSSAGDLGGTPVRFLSAEDFIMNKEAAARPQDLADAARLRELIERKRSY